MSATDTLPRGVNRPMEMKLDSDLLTHHFTGPELVEVRACTLSLDYYRFYLLPAGEQAPVEYEGHSYLVQPTDGVYVNSARKYVHPSTGTEASFVGFASANATLILLGADRQVLHRSDELRGAWYPS